MMMDKELKRKIKKMTEELIEEDKKKKELLNARVDYEFLQKLMDKCSLDTDLIVTIYLKSGDKITITQKTQAPEQYGFDGQPSEIEVR